MELIPQSSPSSACDGNFSCIEPLEPRMLFTAVPLITEFLASNDGVLLDEDGDSSDWLEIYNAGTSVLDLTGWHLTDDDADLSQWSFPSIALDPGAYLVVFASNKDRADADGTELHTNFRLGAGGEYLALVEDDGSTVAFEFSPAFPAQQTDVSYGFTQSISSAQVLVDDDTPLTYHLPTNGSLGTTWTQSGFNDNAWTAESAGAGIGYEDNPGATYDYSPLIDTTVPSGTTSAYARFEFNLADPAAFNQLTLRAMYDDGFVAYLNGTLVQSQFAPGSPVYNSVATGGLGDDVVLEGFVDFNISAHLGSLQAGTNVLAVHALNVPGNSDMLFIPELLAESITVDTGDAGYFSTPTPGAANGESFDGFVGDTQFSVDRGFFDTAFNLTITTPDTPDALIVYTTDGSAPTVDSALNITNGIEYTGAINIASTTNVRAAGFKLGFEPTNIDTQTYLFLGDVVQQTSSSQESVLEQGLSSSAGNGVDFGLDPDILNSVSAQAFEDGLLSIPTVSLTIDNADFLGTSGIWSNPTQRGSAWERAVSVELINPDGSVGFQEDAGLRIQGAASRTHADKYSLRLAFRDDYGARELRFPFFGDGVDEFDTIILRSVFNDGYGWKGDNNNLREQLYVRDLWFRETQAAMGQPSARGNWAHLYVNGQYWGLYHPSERPDADFAAETLGGDNDNYDAINHGGVIDDASENNPNDNTSATQVYDTAISLANAVNSASGVAAQWAAFQQLQGNFSNGIDDPSQEDYLDVENYIDYMILNFWGGNDDWPNNNWFTNRLRGPDSEGFRFFSWDTEISLGLSTRTDVNENYTGVSTGAAEFYGILRNYDEFLVQFGDQAHMHLFNDGALAGSNPADRFNALAQPIRDAIIGESARWGDQHFSNNPITQAEWDAALDDILNDYFVQRPGIVLSQLRAAGLYSTVEAVSWNKRGGLVTPDFDITLNAPQGTIYYTLDGSDPRLLGGAVSGNAIAYTGPINLGVVTTVQARVLHNGTWSALDKADFISTVPTPEQEYLRIAELHYNPTGPTASELSAGFTDGDQFEFIELLNTSATQTLDLSGVSFSNGVAAQFAGSASSILNATFNSSTDGFSFSDNAFNGTTESGVASGSRDSAGGNGGGGALRVDLASADSGPDHGPSSGAYQRTFNLASAGEVTLNFDYRFLFEGGFESNEIGQLIAELDSTRLGGDVDGSLVAFTGDGNNGPASDSGWRTFGVTLNLSAGTHTLALGAYYNKSTLDDEGVTGWFDNVSLTTPLPLALAPGERALLVSDLAAFTQRYGQPVVDAAAAIITYTGNLSNSGERLALIDANALPILDFIFEDGNGPGEEAWPTTPDGDGPSLVVVNTENDYNNGSNWQASSTPNGTPGTDPAVGQPGDITGDGFVGIEDLDQLLAYWGDAAVSSPEANAADLDNSGTVGGSDLSILFANFGAGSPSANPTSNGDVPDDPDPSPDSDGDYTGSIDDGGAGNEGLGGNAAGEDVVIDDVSEAIAEAGTGAVSTGGETPGNDWIGGNNSTVNSTIPASIPLREGRGDSVSSPPPDTKKGMGARQRGDLDVPPNITRAAASGAMADALNLLRSSQTVRESSDTRITTPKPRRFDALAVRQRR